MNFDMGGSAAVLGAAKALGQIKPPGVEVHFIIAACKNIINSTGMSPGDIVNGKTIKVNNTNAEGRLALADALIYACNQGVEKLLVNNFNYLVVDLSGVVEDNAFTLSPGCLLYQLFAFVHVVTLQGYRVESDIRTQLPHSRKKPHSTQESSDETEPLVYRSRLLNLQYIDRALCYQIMSSYMARCVSCCTMIQTVRWLLLMHVSRRLIRMSYVIL